MEPIMARRKTKLKVEEILEATDNVAERLTEEKLDEIGTTVVDGYEIDKRSRAEWEERDEQMMKLAMQVVEIEATPEDQSDGQTNILLGDFLPALGCGAKKLGHREGEDREEAGSREGARPPSRSRGKPRQSRQPCPRCPLMQTGNPGYGLVSMWSAPSSAKKPRSTTCGSSSISGVTITAPAATPMPCSIDINSSLS